MLTTKTGPDRERDAPKPEVSGLDRLVDEENLESFPASDPPTWTSLHARESKRRGRPPKA